MTLWSDLYYPLWLWTDLHCYFWSMIRTLLRSQLWTRLYCYFDMLFIGLFTCWFSWINHILFIYSITFAKIFYCCHQKIRTPNRVTKLDKCTKDTKYVGSQIHIDLLHWNSSMNLKWHTEIFCITVMTLISKVTLILWWWEI